LLYAAKTIVPHVNSTRRRVLFVGAAGAVALVAARWFAPGGTFPPAAPGLSTAGAEVVRALVPAMLDGALPPDPDARKTAIEETVGAVSAAIEGLPPLTRDELGTLFALLAFAPMRVAFAGTGTSWQSASVDDVQAFLGRLHASRWAVKRAAYDALHQLVFAAWYANPRAWPAIGYPGPPALA